MKRSYTINQQFIGCLLLVSLLLQSCSGLGNPCMPIEKNKIAHIQTDTSTATTAYQIDVTESVPVLAEDSSTSGQALVQLSMYDNSLPDIAKQEIKATIRSEQLSNNIHIGKQIQLINAPVKSVQSSIHSSISKTTELIRSKQHIRKNQHTAAEKRNKHLTASLLKYQQYTIKGGYEIQFSQTKGKLQAIVRKCYPTGFSEQVLPVIITPGFSFTEKEVVNEGWQQQYVHIFKDYVYVGQSGLLGGMKLGYRGYVEDELHTSAVPDEYCCPITKQIMAEPVMAADGYTYEKSAIEQHMNEKGAISPFIRKPLTSTNLIPNQGLKRAIQNYVEKNKKFYEQQCIKAIQEVDINSLLHLEKLGINIDVADENGWTLIHYVIYQAKIEHIKFCLNRKFNINAASASLKGLYFPPDLPQLIAAQLEEINIKAAKYNLSAKITEQTIFQIMRELENQAKANDYSIEKGQQSWEAFERDAIKVEQASYNKAFFSGSAQNAWHMTSNRSSYFSGSESRRRNWQHYHDNLSRWLDERNQVVALLAEVKKIEQNINILQQRKQCVFNNLAPLHLATAQKNEKIIMQLIQLGADLELKDGNGTTPIFWAVYQNELKLLKLFVDNGANLQVSDNQGNTLLHVAAQYADLNIINYLIEIGFYHLQENHLGQTAIAVALKYERKAIADFINKKGAEGLQAALFRINRGQQQRKDSSTILGSGSSQSNLYYPASLSNPTPLNKPSNTTSLASNTNLHLTTLPPSPAYDEPQSAGRLAPPLTSATQVTEQFSRLRISYEIPYQALHFQQELGRGGFGIVYKGAYQDKLVAIKQLMNQDLSKALIHNFKQEISMMARLESPYVIKFIGACFQAPHYSLVMDYMPNGDLYHFLQKPGQIDWQLRYQIATDIGHGVNYLHSHGIIHGDLKSLNILLDKNYQAKITDFGLAKIKISSSISTLVGGQKGGSLRWMAPELLTAEEEETSNTKASDVYSYGMVLWELGARQIPYANKRDPQVLALKLQNKHEPITPDTPPSISALIQWCWKERTKRPAITEAVETLEKEQRLLLNK
ncbi:hypothetical protein Aasi_1443 [Candidatus Amoebophilus asiaticus 5a2]|uniref:Uncharacterized protein n=1 Tax=Amoebophilus asiaticus (strain 5a2) TaxID=452471 RepID=B3EU30_AMOA5|nr:protein kinase [Candidatus Amoebophilus asiaticus]ACE06732.1 hypothetical protein Aasi_1443 [Candidatus Amoebophilus asiaticus 5a2]